MATVHTLTALTDLLQDNIQQKTVNGNTVNYIILDSALLDEAGEIVSYFGVSSIEVDNAVVTPSNSNVVLTGVAQVLNLPSDTVLTGIVVNGVVRLTFSVVPQNAGTNWNISQNFTSLPSSELQNSVGIQVAPSVINSLSLSAPRYFAATYQGTGFVRGLNFTSTLNTSTGALQPVYEYFPPGNQVVELSGTITVGSPYPVMNLQAQMTGFDFNLLNGFQITNTHLWVYSDNVQRPDEEARSGVKLAGKILLAGVPMIVTANMLQGNFAWGFDIQIPREAGISIGNSLSVLSPFFNGWELPTPPSLPGGFDIYLTGVSATVAPNNSAIPLNWTLMQVSVTIAMTTEWIPPLPNLAITEISLTWSIYFLSDGTPDHHALLTGIFQIGTPPDTANLIVEVEYPTWTIHAFLRGGDTISVSSAMNYFTGGLVSIPDMDVTIADFQGQPLISSYMFYTAIEGIWPFPVPFGNFRQMNMEVDYIPSSLSGYISAQFDISGKMFFVQAEKLPGGTSTGWVFSGGLFYGYEFTAQDLVNALTVSSWQPTLPDSLQSLALTELYLRFNTALSTYAVRAGIAWNYTIPSTDIDLKTSARFTLNADRLSPTADMIYSGSAEGAISINNFGVLMRYSFAPGSETIYFELSYKKLKLMATLSTKPDPKDKSKSQSILTIGFGDLSFGEIIEYLVHLANPNVEFKLDSPWDILYDINFKNLTLTANLTTKEVGISYKLDVNFLFVYIDSIGLSYKTVNGKGKVFAQISGRFLDQEYGTNGAEPLEWDVIDDPAPEVPGEQSAFIDIRYVGLGQHVAIDNVSGFQNVEDVINALRQYMLPPESGDQNPLIGANGLKFDENSHWLFGLDVTLIGAIRLAVVFNDPQLYGLLVGLSGERMGSLSGLKFQILYVKITDTIGVFRIELRVPEAFRQLEFGEVSITLPIIKLEIYTNGNFRVDLGFPHNGDFTDSFCLQIFPFIGYGGFYFALLNGSTSKRVPTITNGTFNPVIEAGIGLSVGLGKTFNKGPLKAGISITVEGIVEGVLAWFNPTDKSQPAPMYYWMQGTIAIVGKLYGSVDFAIIKVDVSVTAYASVTLVIEAYAPIFIQLKVGVEVKASVKILFVRIHFSFSLELEESFTIGEHKPTPWTVAAPQSSNTKKSSLQAGQPGKPVLRMQRASVPVRAVKRIHTRHKLQLRAMSAMPGLFAHMANGRHMLRATSSQMTWNPSVSVFGSVVDLHVLMTPSFTVAIPSALPGGGTGTTPQIEAVIGLFAENSISPAATDNQSLRRVTVAHSSRVSDPAESPFNVIVQAMLLYVTNALPRDNMDTITSADLELLDTLLAQEEAYDTGFSYANLDTFMSSNFVFQVSGIPSEGSGSNPVSPLPASSTVFPMPPVITMTLPGSGGSVDFASQPYLVDENYEDKITEYLAQLSVNVTSNVADNPLLPTAGGSGGGGGGGGTESFSTMIFRDYFMMVARSAVQESISLLANYPWPVQPGDTLAGIAGSSEFPKVEITYEVKTGDTWQSVADMFNMTVAELQALNPSVPAGEPIAPPLELNVLSGVTVQEVGTANQDVLLNAPYVYQVQSGDTWASIAALFRLTVAQLQAFNPTVSPSQNPPADSLLQVRTAATYSVEPGDTWASVAAEFGMTVAQLQALNPSVPPGQPIAPPLVLNVLPYNGLLTPNTFTLSGIHYQAKNTDSFDSVAALFGISTTGLAAGNAAVTGLLNQGAAFSIAQPQNSGVPAQFSYTSQAGDSLNFISAWFLVRNTVISGGVTNIALLAPGSSIIDSQMLSWYAQTIYTLTTSPPHTPPAGIDWQQPLPVGTTLLLPSSYNVTANPPLTYVTREGDTIDFVAGYFAMTQNANAAMLAFATQISNLNPSVNWNNLAAGTVIAIPGMTRTLQGNDTLNSLAALYGISAGDLASVNAAASSVIATLAVFLIPPFTYSVIGGDTLASIAANYNLTVDDVSLLAENTAGLFPVLDGQSNPVLLSVTHVMNAEVSGLLSNVVSKGHSNNIAASVSRFLLHGLRLPLPADVPGGNTPIPPSTPLYPVYALTGQQFTAPVQPISTAYNITFTNSGNKGWLNFADSYVVQPGDTWDSIATMFGTTATALQALNPGVSTSQPLVPGTVLLTAITSSLTISITDSLASSQYPSTTFTPDFTQPSLMRLYDDQQVRYTMAKFLHWQTPSVLPFPAAPGTTAPTAGEPGIWIFPTQLMAKLAAGNFAGKPFELDYSTGHSGSTDDAVTVGRYFWSTFIGFSIRSVADTAQPGQVLANTYEISAADQVNRNLLLSVWTYLQNGSDTASLYLLYPPNSSSANPSGLLSATVGTASTFILKTNLSTETTSGGFQRRAFTEELAGTPDPDPADYRADFSNPEQFLKFIWEAAIVGTGGYYLNYADSGGNGLPGSVFDQSGNAMIWLAVVLNSQTQGSQTRVLQPFNNCAISGENLDPTTMNVFMRLSDGSDLLRAANVPPGNTGFDMLMPNPDPELSVSVTPAQRTNILFSLFGYSVGGNTLFAASNSGLPLSPQDPDKNPAPPALYAAFDEEADLWHFHQVIPVSKLALNYPLAVCAALPDPTADPYAGIALVPDPQNPGNMILGSATVNFAFYDLYGNYSSPSGPTVTPQPVTAPVGYFDDIIGLSQWPGLSAHYMFSGQGGANGTPYLDLLFGFRTDDYIAGVGNSFDKAVYAASAHYTRYQQIYYQIAQPQVSTSMSTSLVQTSSQPAGNQAFALNQGILLGYVSSAYVFLSAAKQLSAGQAVISASSNNTLSAILTAYNCSYEELAAVNSSRRAQDIFAGLINIPYFLTTQAGQTLTDITAAANAMLPPAVLTPLAIVNANMNAALSAAIDLAVPSRTVTVNTAPGSAETASLLSLSKQLYSTPASIATANPAPNNSIITPGITLQLDGLTYVTVENDSFQNITDQFNLLGASVTIGNTTPYTIGDVAGANESVLNLITGNAQLTISDYLTQPGDTFTSIQTLFPANTPAAITGIPSNLLLKNIYVAGQALSLFSRTETPFANDTVQSIADSYLITPLQLFVANPSTALQTVNHGTSQYPTNVLTVPRLFLIGTTLQQNGYVPYAMKENDTLDNIATAFYGSSNVGTNALALATINQEVTWVMAPGMPITLGAGTTTVAGDSFQSVLNRINVNGAGITLAQLVSSIESQTGYLAENAFFVCPLPSSGTSTTSLSALETSFHSDAVSIARANASLAGFLKPGQTVSLTRIVSSQPVVSQLQINPNDTFSSLVYRFKNEKNIDTTVSDIAFENKAADIIAGGQRFLLAPAEVEVQQSLGTGYSANPRYPDTVFEVTVDVAISRDTAYISPDFTSVASVISNKTVIAPNAGDNTSGELTLTAFALQFETAFTGLKAALGRAESGASDRAQPIWAVYFGTTGISTVNIDTAAPSYYALRPLSNVLVSKNNIPISTYSDGVLLSGANQNFQGVDPETWALTVLAAIDRMLTPAYAAPSSAAATPSQDAYTRIMDAKKKLADKISAGLDYVLDVSVDSGKRDKAREALKDQLLINLTNAYASDALLQYDVAVTASFPGQTTAPNLSGTPVSSLYLTGPADSVQSIASVMQVNDDYLAEEMADMTGILNTGLVVTYPSKGNYTILSSDTLATLAGYYQVTLSELIAGLTWSNPTEQGLFLAATIVNIMSVSVSTGTRTIEAIAGYFMEPIEEWAWANADSMGIFIVGTVITVSEPGYTPVTVTTQNNSLSLVAAAMGGSVPMTPEQLALDLRSTTGILASAFVSYMVVTDFDYSASAGKLSLKTGTNQMNFLFNVKSEREFRKELLRLNYAITEMEFNIRSVQNGEDYKASSWLTFLIPIGSSNSHTGVIDTGLGQPDIPLPLRSYPVAPVILSQTAAETYRDDQLPATYPQNLQQAKLWNFAFTYRHQEAAQDTSYVMAAFHTDTSVSPISPPDTMNSDFFRWLAQFVSVWPAMQKDLDGLLQPGNPASSTTAALDTFAILVENIANTWSYSSSLLADTTVMQETIYEYGVTAQNEHRLNPLGKQEFLRKSITFTPKPPGQEGPGSTYPNVYYIDTTAENPAPVQMTAFPNTNDCVYVYPGPDPIPVDKVIDHIVEFTSLDILQYQNAIGGAFATRNETLTETATNPSFIFQTPEVLYNHSIVPYIERDIPIVFGSPPQTLQAALTTLFNDLLGTATPRIKAAALYGYRLSPGTGSDGIISRLPISFLPLVTYDSSIPANLATVVTDWEAANPVAQQGGQDIFDLSIFSENEESKSKPLLRLSDLVYNLTSGS